MEKKNIFCSESDLDIYGREVLLEIENPTERAQAKELYQSFFKPFYQYMEQKYADLEKKMEQRYYGKNNAFTIVTGICERSRLPLYEEYMFPMLLKDKEERILNVLKMQEDIQRNEKSFCYTIFMQKDKKQIEKLLNCKRKFHGVVYTMEGEFPAQFVIYPNREYQEQIQILQETFLTNQIPWEPVFAPYTDKLFDVYIVSMDYPLGEEIIQMEIDFEEYAPFIKYKHVPVWNIEYKKKQSSTYPVFQKDSVNYIHTIFASQLNDKSDYLVNNKTHEYWSIGRTEGDLLITSTESEPVIWDLLEIHDCNRDSMEKDYPFCKNVNLNSTHGKPVHTKAEILRFVNGLGLEQYLKLTDVKYQNEDQLVLEFQNKIPDYYLRYDILDYIVSRVQWELKEYECMGIFR